ncbi:MAG: hypothetical protein NZ580_03740 [Bacteroidia bacterium]|nr:hypothetical protein [Bacteroidia bacterium]MDW8235441.1 hypothetical protein [Bacteroidia bacterium]
MGFLGQAIGKFRHAWAVGAILMLTIIIITLVPTVGIFWASPFVASLARYGKIVWLESRQPRLGELFSMPLSHYMRVGVVWAGIFAIASAILLLYINSKIHGFPHLKPFAFPGYVMPLGAVALIAAGSYFFLYSYPFLIIDQDKEIVPAITRSIKLSLTYPWHALALTLLAMILNTTGLLLCGVGTLITTPLTFIVSAGVYVKTFYAAKMRA